MAIKSGKTVDPQLIANATAALMTVGAGERRVITDATVFANAIGTLVLYVLPSGGTATTTTQVLTRALALGDTYIVSELIGKGVESGGAVHGNDGGNGGTVMNIDITYTEYTGENI